MTITTHTRSKRGGPGSGPQGGPKPYVPHPREPAGPKATDPKSKSEKAKESHVLVGKDIQRYAEEHNEPAAAKALGGLSFKDNEPVDIVVGHEGVVKHGVELKTVVANTNGKITMKGEALTTTSCTATTLGWRIFAAAWASRTKRSRLSGEAICSGGSILRATSRRSAVSRA